jgi:uncharacterized secreted protein with C-terminal beta-propeller domain
MPLRTHRVTLAMLALVGCSTDESTAPSAWQARLNPIAGCEEAKSYVKEVALEKMRANLDAQLASYLDGDMCFSRGGGLEDASGQPTPGAEPPASGPTNSTGTNNQVTGIDEADFVKNDGQYIYLAQNKVLRIVDAWPADQTHEVSKTALPGAPKKLFVQGNRVLVYVAMGTVGQSNSGWQAPECTYGYDCEFTGDGTQTKLMVFDIADRASPRLVREVDLAGSLISARRIEDAVHTVVTQGSTPYADLKTFPEGDFCSYGGGEPPLHFKLAAQRAFAKLRADNEKAIAEVDLDLRLKGIRDSFAPDVDPTEAACKALYASPQQDGTAFTSIVSLNLQQPAPATISTIISRPGAIYADSDSLYMAVGHLYSYDDDGKTEQRSTIHKFAIGRDPGQTKYIGSGTVPGRALNQFAMDEKDNFLRIATTIGHAPSSEGSVLSVLGEDAFGDLEVVGSIDKIAPTEDIRSVRFDDDRAFMVTFKKTDPLFTFDLSNPRNPQKLGELKIPGFSTYMHMLDANHLLTIGFDADDHGSFAFFDGVMLQIFDVSDMSNPTLAHKHVIGTRGSSSEALTNHLAFTWYPAYSMLSIPMTICEGGNDGQYGSTMSFSGLMLFDGSVTAGFGEHGRVAHPVSQNISCSNWWTDAKSVVRRSLFLDQYVYSISDKQLKVRDTTNTNAPLVDLDIEN